MHSEFLHNWWHIAFTIGIFFAFIVVVVTAVEWALHNLPGWLSILLAFILGTGLIAYFQTV